MDKFSLEDKKIHEDSTCDLSMGKIGGETQIVTIKADMLDFLSRLPNESVCILINGINLTLIPYVKFHEAIAKEIARVTEKNGVILGVNSTCLHDMARILNPSIDKETNDFPKAIIDSNTTKRISNEERIIVLVSNIRNTEKIFFKSSTIRILEKEK